MRHVHREAPALTTQGKDGRAALLEQAIRKKREAAGARSSRLPLRPADREPRLGELQRSLWLQHQLEPDSAAYHLTSAFRVTGELDPVALERAMTSVVARHRILRSTYSARRDGVVQVVHEPVPLRIERLTAEAGGASERATRAAREPFDLERGPLIRMLLVEEPAGGDRLLVLVMHHILSDERSLALLWRELAERYGSEDPPADDAAEPQYDDYVHWASQRDSRERSAGVAFWRERLHPLPDEQGLPFENPGGAAGPRGRLLSRPLGVESKRSVERATAALGTTPFSVLAFTFRLLLHRITQGRDVAFATPVSMRSHPAAAEMVGYFLNPVVVRLPIDESPPVEEAMREFGDRLRECLAQASVPFDVLVEELAPPRRGGRHPIFRTMFVYQAEAAAPELGSARLEPVALDLGESKFDLTLFVSESGGSLEVSVEYREERYDAVWMRRLLDQYATLLEGVTGSVEPTGSRTSVADLPILTPRENREIDELARGAPLDLAGADLLPLQILEQARRSPDAPSVIGEEGSWSYGELRRAGLRIAAELRALGVEPGDRVGLFLDRSPRMIAGVMGCHWAGAAYVPLDPAYPSERNRAVLDDARVAAVVSRGELLERLPESPAPVLDADAPAAAEPSQESSAAVTGEQPAYLLYTSGSTGRPKGVVVTHDNLKASNQARFEAYDFAPKRFLLLPSVAFDSSVAGLFWTLAGGGALVIPTDEEARDPRRLASLVEEKRVTSLLCVPSLYAHLLAAGGDRLRSLESVIVAGESCAGPLVERHFRELPETRLFNEYGPTEATVWATLYEIERRDARRPVAIGRPIPGVRVDVLDALGRRVPAGVPGQGWIAGPTVAEGYWGRPDLTEERFAVRTLDGESRRMYTTGDLISRTEDGRLLFLGRVDEQIKLRGFRIEPGEIEAALLAEPGVRDAAVVLRDSDRLVAFVSGSESAAGLRRRLAERLPEFMVPGRIVTLEALPQLPNGKVDRARLKELPLATEAATGESPVLGDREQALASLWEGLLGRTGVGPDDNFFELGGHSLLVVEMASAIEKDFGVELAPAEVFQTPTVRELAERLERRSGPSGPLYSHLFPLQPGGHRAPFIFAIPHFFSEMAVDRFRGERPVYGLRGVGLRPEGNRGRWPTMRDLANELVEEITRRFPGESCFMAGYSFGATMAVEAVRLMEERGIPVERLYLIAPMAVDLYRAGPLRFQIDGLRGPVEDLSLGEALGRFARANRPLSRRAYQRAWRLLAVQPWRRLLCRVGELRTRAGKPLTPRILHADVRLERFRLHASYRPGVVHTPTVIFNAREPETDAAATWRPYFAGPFTVHETPDPHLDDASIRAAKELILHHWRELEDSC